MSPTHGILRAVVLAVASITGCAARPDRATERGGPGGRAGVRAGLWASQLQLDAEQADDAAVNGDLFALDYVRERILHTLAGDDVTEINLLMEEIG